MDHDFIALLVQEKKDREQVDGELRDDIGVEVRAERKARMDLSLQQREYVDEQDRDHARQLLSFLFLPFYQRWVWMLFGGRGLQWSQRLRHRIRTAYQDWRDR